MIGLYLSLGLAMIGLATVIRRLGPHVSAGPSEAAMVARFGPTKSALLILVLTVIFWPVVIFLFLTNRD